MQVAQWLVDWYLHFLGVKLNQSLFENIREGDDRSHGGHLLMRVVILDCVLVNLVAEPLLVLDHFSDVL